MKTFRLLFAAALLICAFGVNTALAQQVIVANGTGDFIHVLGLADTNAGGEPKDLLGDEVMAPDEGVTINLSGSPKGWDLVAQDGNNNQVSWKNLDLTGVKKITLRPNGSADLE